MFAVWNDKCGNGISEQDVHLRSFPAMQVLAEKLWKGENKNVTYEAFAKLCKTTPEAPGINLLGKVPAETALTEAGKELSFNGKEAVSTPLQEVGYPYSVEFQLCPEKTNPISSILF